MVADPSFDRQTPIVFSAFLATPDHAKAEPPPKIERSAQQATFGRGIFTFPADDGAGSQRGTGVDAICARFQPASQKLLNAWWRLPRPNIVPKRASFDPCDIASILPVIALIERAATDEWRVRLAGTEIERRWGRGLSGLTYAEVLSAEVAEVTHCEFEAICRHPCGSWSLRHLELRSGRRLQTETLRLPLRDKHGDVTLIVSCNGELNPDLMREPDKPREIVTVCEQQFFDIGAGIPDFRCVPV